MHHIIKLKYAEIINVYVHLIQPLVLKKYNMVVGIFISIPMWYLKGKL